MKKRYVIILVIIIIGIGLTIGLYSNSKLKETKIPDEYQTINGVVIKKENQKLTVKLEETINGKNIIEINNENYNINDIVSIKLNKNNNEIKEVASIWSVPMWNAKEPTEEDVNKFSQAYESKLVETYKNQISVIDVLSNRNVEVFILPVKNEGSYLQNYSPREYAYHYLHIFDISLWPIKFNANQVGTIKMNLPNNAKVLYLGRENLLKNSTFEEVNYTTSNNSITFNVTKNEESFIYYARVLLDKDNIIDVIICVNDSY